VDAWSKKCSNLCVWDYWLARRGKGFYGAPSVFPHALKEWYLLDCGRIKGRSFELCEFDSEGKSLVGDKDGDWGDWMFDSLNVYVAMRLMWNMDQDVNQILDEFYDQFFGPVAGPLVRQFYTRMENAYLNPVNKGGPNFRWDWSICWQNTYPPELVAEVMGFLRQAEKSTRGQEPYHARAEATLKGFLPFEAASQRWHTALKKTTSVKNMELIVPDTAVAPRCDGSLDDPAWRKAVVLGEFVDSYNSSELKAKTEIRLLRDDRNLHVGIRAELPQGCYKQDLPPKSVDGWVWDEESCEVFLVQGVKKYQFLIGPENIYADNFHPDLNTPFSTETFKWNCKDVQYQTHADPKEWTAELAIPLASLELTAPTKANPWRVNFTRNYHYALNDEDRKNKKWQLPELSTWQPTLGSFHNVERFGTLYFEPDRR
jgi:hypothetical protein